MSGFVIIVTKHCLIPSQSCNRCIVNLAKIDIFKFITRYFQLLYYGEWPIASQSFSYIYMTLIVTLPFFAIILFASSLKFLHTFRLQSLIVLELDATHSAFPNIIPCKYLNWANTDGKTHMISGCYMQ